MKEIIRTTEIELENERLVKILTISDTETKIAFQVLVNEVGLPISPEVKYIRYENNSGLFLIQDKLPIDEFMTGGLFYYVDSYGDPMGYAFFDLKEGIMSIPFDDSKSFIEGYFNFKLDICKSIRSEIMIKKEKDVENVRKLSLSKKG